MTTGTSRSAHWKDRGAGLEGGAYQAKYGRRWKEEVKATLGRGGNAVCDVTDLMQHIFDEGDRVFEDTPYRRGGPSPYWIYHDALSSWWSKAAQEYARRKGFLNRQVRGLGFTNEDNRYAGKLPGDTPEYMPLDSNLFSDLETMVRWNVAGTFELPKDHPDKFELSTPKKAWEAIERTWEYAPTPDRIVEDINRVFDAIEQVVKARGKAVDFDVLRHGRRYCCTLLYCMHVCIATVYTFIVV